MPDAVIVVPCHNEARRLRPEAFEAFARAQPGLRFLFVDDGSSDATAECLRTLVARDPERLEWLGLTHNAGKAEAVRAGMQRALRARPDYAGYWDADLATPLEEIPRFLALLEERRDLEWVLGSRVRLLGRDIGRRALRHYPGRLMATLISLCLELPVYDTQCGAKLFRVTAEFEDLWHEPFRSGWVFDVELIARLIRARRGTQRPPAEAVVYELPLQRWCDVPGSQVGPLDFARGVADLWRIRRSYLGRV